MSVKYYMAMYVVEYNMYIPPRVIHTHMLLIYEVR